MNTAFSRYTILLVLIQASELFGQSMHSPLVDIWKYPDYYNHPSQHNKALEADFYEPLGVANLLYFNFHIRRWTEGTLQKIEGSITSFPGFSQYYFGGEIGKNINSKIQLSQHLGFAVLMSKQSHPPSFLLYTRNLIKLDINPNNRLMANIGNFPSLIWPISGHISDFYLHLYWVHKVYRDIDIRLAMWYQIDSELQLTTAIHYPVNNSHLLFAGFTLRPFNLGIGYVYVRKNFRLCIMLEQSPLFGFVPYTSAGCEF